MTTQAADVLDALGDASRRAILDRLAAGERPVGELAAGLPISRPAVSQHLRVLERAGLVTSTRAGTRHVYRLDRSGLDAVRDYLDRFWDTALTRFADLAADEATRTHAPSTPGDDQ